MIIVVTIIIQYYRSYIMRNFCVHCFNGSQNIFFFHILLDNDGSESEVQRISYHQ